MDVSPFYLVSAYKTESGRRVCFTARTKTPEKNNDCNTMDFYKLELAVSESPCPSGWVAYFVLECTQSA